MNQQFKVEIEVEIDYDYGSPTLGDDTYDAYVIRQPEYLHFESIWTTREGPTEGALNASMSGLYHNFTDTTRRTVFCQTSYGLPITTWGGSTLHMGNIFLTTDSAWPDPLIAISYSGGSPSGDGRWFACEGETEDEYRVYPQGATEEIAL